MNSIITIIAFSTAFVGLLWLLDRAFAEQNAERKRELRAVQRAEVLHENAVDELAVRIQLDREQLFRDYLKSEEDTKWKY